jgi:hypothetical protein
LRVRSIGFVLEGITLNLRSALDFFPILLEQGRHPKSLPWAKKSDKITLIFSGGLDYESYFKRRYFYPGESR